MHLHTTKHARRVLEINSGGKPILLMAFDLNLCWCVQHLPSVIKESIVNAPVIVNKLFDIPSGFVEHDSTYGDCVWPGLAVGIWKF